MDRIRKLAAALPEDIDCAMITSGVGRRYYTGFPSSAGVLLVTRRGAALVLDSRYIEAGRKRVTGAEVVLMTADADRQLNGLFEKYGIRTVGIESGYMTVEKLLGLRAVLAPRIADDPRLQTIITRQRMIKSAEELEKIRAAQAVTDRAFSHMLEVIRPGVSEKDLQLELDFFMLRNGADSLAFDTIVAAGRNGSMPHAVPGNNRVKCGDFVTMDFGAAVDGYCSDMTRTVAVGKISREQRSVYSLVLRAQEAACRAVKPGVLCSDIDAAARDIICSAGYGDRFGHGLGHSLGLEIHEEPRFSVMCAEITRPGLVMSVEPGIYLDGQFGVRIEDIVHITQDGCENLTHSEKKLTEL